MAEPRPFRPVKLVCGILAAEEAHFEAAESRLSSAWGEIDIRSGRFPFVETDYYAAEIGPRLRRSFVSFAALIAPEALSAVKLRTNAMEKEIGRAFGASRRAVNLDPGYLTEAALIMATAKNFSHRVPLQEGIYAHLEFLFSRTGIRRLEWTYPDFAKPKMVSYFLEVRRAYRRQLKSSQGG
ncbi:MAG: DUF4416 family protein [Candidatus Aminicenantes bacterium]|nr:DUF4416 family protein [Candidatus Aminicenantes bacterium]